MLTVRDERRQKTAAEAIEHAGGRAFSRPTWLGRLLRDPSLVSVYTVDLSGGSVTDATLAHLQALSQLTALEVDSTSVSDAGMVNLQRLTSLRCLWLEGNRRITGTGLRHLQGLSHLVTLDLSGTSVTGRALANLERLKDLCIVDLRHTEVTYAAVDRLQCALPHCAILVRDDQVPSAGGNARESAPGPVE
jgi:hypothetical protein